MNEFNDKVAVVTGAGSGIGRALARHAASLGMRVAAADLHAGRLAALHKEITEAGGTIVVQPLDVADASAFKAFGEYCLAELGTPDMLFNNAGILRVGETWGHSADDWHAMLSVNVMGVVNGINVFLPGMLEKTTPSHIVNTGSVGSLVAATGMAQYTATKMAVRGISECLLNDLVARDAPIGVSLLCPGPVLTSISDDLMGVEAASEVVESQHHDMAGLPDFKTPEAVAEIVFDAVRDNRFWIFSHPFSHYLRTMQEGIANAQNPYYSEVTFD